MVVLEGAPRNTRLKALLGPRRINLFRGAGGQEKGEGEGKRKPIVVS